MTEIAQKSPDRILYLLKSRGPMTSAQLSDVLGITPAGARQHMAALEAEGLVGFEEQSEGVGRPSRVWHLTAKANQRFPETHADLAVGMIEAIRAAMGEAGLSQVLEHRNQRQLAHYSQALAHASSLKERVAALAHIRTQEGYLAAWVEDGDGFLLVENHCPICAAATVCTGICDGELAIFQALLGEGVCIDRKEHIVAGARRCTYEIAEVGGDSDGKAA